MSWEIMLKDLRSRATSPEAMRTRMGSGQYQSRDNPMFDKEEFSDLKIVKVLNEALKLLQNKPNVTALSIDSILIDDIKKYLEKLKELSR